MSPSVVVPRLPVYPRTRSQLPVMPNRRLNGSRAAGLEVPKVIFRFLQTAFI